MSTTEVRDSLLALAEAVTHLADTVRPEANIADTITEFRSTGRAFTRVGNALAEHFQQMVEDPEFEVVLAKLQELSAQEQDVAIDPSPMAVAAFEAGIDRASDVLRGWWYFQPELEN